MHHHIGLICMALICLAAVSGCWRSTAPTKADAVEHDTVATVAAIRAAGAKFDSSVEVHPLRDPAVDGLLHQAQDLEDRSQPAQALASLRKALVIAPKAPDLLQYEAELLIETGDWKQAAAVAQQSWDSGPKVGGLCARNLETLAHARNVLGDAAGAAQARQQLIGCRVPAPARF
jgi:tetratricopeptide (TPR) repeat protein